PAGLIVEGSGAGAAGGRQLTRAFYTNLDALSLLAVLVGGFMIYNTMAFFVVQRAPLFARLRALGVTRRAIAGHVAFEAGVLGLLGGVLGDALGVVLARRLAGPMAQTLADHYQSTGLAALALPPALALGGVLLALATTLVAALAPAWQAASLPPGQALVSSTRRAHEIANLRRAGWASLLCLVTGLVLLGATTRSLYAGFGALAALLLAAMLAVPAVVGAALRALARRAAGRLPLPERLALQSATHALARIGLAVAALMAATATSIGVGLMVTSFRVSVDDWLQQLLRADYYLAQEDAEQAPPTIGPDFAAAIAALPGVAAVSRVRRLEANLADGDRARVTAYDLPPAARAGFRFLDDTAARAWPAWLRGEAVFVTEPFAWHHALRPGERVVLDTPCGRLDRPLAGIYRDYGSERGAVAIAWSLYRRCWGDDRAHGIGVYPAAGGAQPALRDRLDALAAGAAPLAVWSNAEVRARSLEVFDRTFAITDVLTLVAAVVAALGVFNALLALHIEHAREYAMLRATGFSRAGLRRTLLAQTAFVAAAAVSCAVPVGIAIAALLTEVINRRSFGWSMQFAWQAQALAVPAALAFLAALAATVYPAARAAAIPPAAALRHD
ncbi:MAG: FtsX-like permease family protein, partial [Gammaproteobacteria bacterium]|nr:FtsX-like permease family protein [Gammaproteobacteria bacterium]